MTPEEKQAQFNEYFTMKYELNVNLTPVNDSFELPEPDNLEEHMPYIFRIASELSAIDINQFRSLKLANETARELVDYLQQQSKKIDLMMSYVLHQQDHSDYQFKTKELGGGGFVVSMENEVEIGTIYETKLFLDTEASAIFCYAEVITCQLVEDKYHISLIYSSIREQDLELVVRASLHLQTRQLKKRSQNKQKN